MDDKAKQMLADALRKSIAQRQEDKASLYEYFKALPGVTQADLDAIDWDAAARMEDAEMNQMFNLLYPKK